MKLIKTATIKPDLPGQTARSGHSPFDERWSGPTWKPVREAGWRIKKVDPVQQN